MLTRHVLTHVLLDAKHTNPPSEAYHVGAEGSLPFTHDNIMTWDQQKNILSMDRLVTGRCACVCVHECVCVCERLFWAIDFSSYGV